MSKITIEEVDNGYIVDCGIDDETGLHARTVFSYGEDSDYEEAAALMAMLEHISEQFRSYDKFGKNNVKMYVGDGHKVDKEENLPPGVPPRRYTSKL